MYVVRKGLWAMSITVESKTLFLHLANYGRLNLEPNSKQTDD